MKFFKPTPARLVITVILLFIAYGGYIQSEAFTEKDADQPALPLARLFEAIPHLWELWVFLLAPLAVTLRVARLDSGPIWFFWTFQLLYYYFLSCVIVLSWNKLTGRHTRYTPDPTSS